MLREKKTQEVQIKMFVKNVSCIKIRPNKFL